MHGSRFEQGPSHDVCSSQAPQPDYPEIIEYITQHEREIFGTPAMGVFDEVPAPRQSRLDGLLGILIHFDDYSSYADMSHDKFSRLKSKMTDKKQMNGQATTVEEILEGGHDALRTIYEAKVIDNDPLVQTLYEIQQHEPPLKEKAFEELMDDALVVFAKDALQEIVSQRIKNNVSPTE
jgi:hypothetical protein